MNVQIVLLFLFGLLVLVSGNHVRVMTRKRNRGDCSSCKQLLHVAEIMASKTLSLFSVDYLGSSGKYNKAMCGYMNHRLFVNGSFAGFTEETRVGFIQEYFARVYNERNFPLTYRAEGVTLRVTDGEVRKFHAKYCVRFYVKVVYFLFFCLFLFVIVAVPVSVIVVFECMIGRLRKAKLF